jgi:hypothetical protein
MHCIVTLVEGNFLFGACVLYNSLLRNGFSGLFVIGCRHPDLLPISARQALTSQAEKIDWMELDTPLHFTNFKPHFMQKVLDRYPQCTAITYLDPDIVVNAPFHWIGRWANGGPAVCADVNWWLPANHPIRQDWLAITKLNPQHRLDLYFNGGFVSILREHRLFLDNWRAIIEQWGDSDNPLDASGDIGAWRKGGRWFPFLTPDQDALNVVVMCWQGSITTLGPDVMGFAGFGELPHAIGSDKPWSRNYLSKALQGIPPRYVDKVFWSYADSPLRPYGNWTVKLKRWSVLLASLLTRIYRR